MRGLELRLSCGRSIRRRIKPTRGRSPFEKADGRDRRTDEPPPREFPGERFSSKRRQWPARCSQSTGRVGRASASRSHGAQGDHRFDLLDQRLTARFDHWASRHPFQARLSGIIAAPLPLAVPPSTLSLREIVSLSQAREQARRPSRLGPRQTRVRRRLIINLLCRIPFSLCRTAIV